jgi:CBS-domain-containing membrane protein
MQERSQHMLLVQSREGQLEGILTKSDLLSALTLNTSNGKKRDLKTKTDNPAKAMSGNGAR